MKQQLCIGIHRLTPAWSEVLNQIGIWFEIVDYANPLTQYYSTIIVNAELNNTQSKLLHEYVAQGGAILEIKGNRLFTDNSIVRTSFVKRLINSSGHQAFQYIPFLDLYDSVEKLRSSKIFDGLIHFETLGKGIAGFFGAEISLLLQKPGYTRKRFYNDKGKYPDEIVSRVSKKALMDAFIATLKELHFKTSKPFIQKWTSPTEKPVFSFRIDSDFGDQKSIDDLYSVLDKHEILGTWFLHVEAHESWLERFHSFQGQEIALHGYSHGTSSSPAKIQENIRRGKYLLELAGYEISGFSAPYGIWKKGLEKALRAFDFNYTSEFTFSYDGLPIQPTDNHLPLQIPVHPICTGSLNRQHYSTEEMKAYFETILLKKANRFEPVLFYHHPLQPGLDVLSHLFELVNSKELKKITFSDFANFWDSRKKHSFQAVYEDGEIEVLDSSIPNHLLQISKDHAHFALAKCAKGIINRSKISEFEYVNSYLPKADEAQQMHKKDFMLMKTSLLDWKNRIRL